MDVNQARGIRKSSPIVTIAAGATPEVLFTRSAAGQNARTVIPRKIMVYNNTGAAVTLDIGVGLAAAFANIWPTFHVLNLFDAQYNEWDLAEVECTADITVQCSALGVMVQIEVEEVG